MATDLAHKDKPFLVTNLCDLLLTPTAYTLRRSCIDLMYEHMAHHGHGPDGHKETNSFFDEILRTPSYALLVAHTADQVLGFAIAFDTGSGILHLEDIVTGKAMRGYGIGQELMRALGTTAQEKGLNTVQWVVARNNLSAQKFYTKIGATRTDDLCLRLGKDDLRRICGQQVCAAAALIAYDDENAAWRPHYSTWSNVWGSSMSIAPQAESPYEQAYAAATQIYRHGSTAFFDIFLCPHHANEATLPRMMGIGFRSTDFQRWEMPAADLVALSPRLKPGPYIPASRMPLTTMLENTLCL